MTPLTGWSYLVALAAAAVEQDDADSGDGGFGDNDGPKSAAGVHEGGDRQVVGQGNCQEPEAEEIHNGGSDGVSRAVEGLEHDHSVGIADIAIAENAQAGDGQWNDERIAGKEMDDRFGEDDEEEANDAEKNHVVETGAPDGSFRALGLLGAEVLADEGSGGVAEAPARHEDEDEDTDSDRVARKGSGAKDADDAHEADPTGVGDEELQDASERDAQEAKQDAKGDANLATKDADAFGAAEQAIELIEHTNAATGEGGEGRAGDAELGKRPPAEDETRVEYEIDDVGDPEQTHGDGGVTRAAEDGVVQEEKHDRSAAAERDAGVAGADRNDLRGSAHRAKQMGPVKETRNADNGRDRESNGDGLNAGNGCAGGGLLPDCTTGHAGGCKCRT